MNAALTPTTQRIVHSCTSKSFSGLEAYVLDLVTWQYKKGFNVELFCRTGSELHQRASALGIPVWAIGATEKPTPLLWLKLAAGWRRRFRAQPVTLHMHAGGEPLFHMPWRKFQKTILHYHIWINHSKKDPWHRALFSGVDEVWTSSETSRAHLATLLPITREAIRVVPYGRDTAKLQAISKEQSRRNVRERFSIPSTAVLGVCVSRIERIKGVGELFDAFVQVAENNSNAYLLLVGDVSPENPEAEKLGQLLKQKHAALPAAIQKRLLMPGFVNPCEPIVAAADFYVLPSYEECMSLAMLDAAILGLPILGTNAGGTPSVARPDESGMLVPPANASALADALSKLFADVELCRRLGDGARSLALQFDREQVFKKITEWYLA